MLLPAPVFGLVLALAGGVALFWSQPPRRAIGWQFPALGALLGAIHLAPSTLWAGLCGLVFALFYIGLQLWELRLHPAISAVLAVSQSAIWTCFALGAAHFGRFDPVSGALLTACLGAFLTWLEWSVLPLWGTAQSFARGWSRAPRLVQFVEFCGVSGAVWCLFLLTALGFRVALAPREALLPGAVLCSLVFILAALNWLGWKREEAAPTLRVAAFSWGEESADFNRNKATVQAIRAASAQGAKLLVTPEAAFQVDDRAAFRRVFGELAKTHRIALSIGYFDQKANQNCIDFINALGDVESRYIKTRLVPLFENYVRGDGAIAGFEVEGATIGGLICQDDNFAAGASRYGRARTQILAVPTHDWRAVKNFHAANSAWRGLEFRLGLIKAASGGISFIAAPRGEILARCDHFNEGAQLLISEMPLASGAASFYARAGEFFPIGCGLAVLTAWMLL